MSIAQINNLSALKGLGTPAGDEVRFMKGKVNAGDPGVAIYEWDSTSLAAFDDATVVLPNGQPSATAGRWIRQVDVRGPVHAEWFGAKGDDSSHNDLTGVRDCLTAIRVAAVYPQKPKVVFLAKTYFLETHFNPADGTTTAAIWLKPGEVLEGQGMDKTTLVGKLVYGDDKTTYVKLAVVRQDASGEANNAMVRDLTIDCWFDNSSAHSKLYATRSAIAMIGGGILVERVKAINFGVGFNPNAGGGDGGECFVIWLANYTGDGGNFTGNTVRECVITQPGTRSTSITIGQGRHMPEITCITIGGDEQPEQPNGSHDPQENLALGGKVVGNKILDIPVRTNSSPYQYSPVHAITVGNCNGTEIAENEIVNCDAAGVYVASWTDYDMVIRNNRMLGVNDGVVLGVQETEVPSLAPNHYRTRLCDNTIVLGRNTQVLQTGQYASISGIGLYIGSGISTAMVRLRDIAIERNFISGTKLVSPDVYAYGVLLQLNTAIFGQITVADNVLELPSPDDRTPLTFNVPYENALVFNPDYRYWPAARDVIVHGNRNVVGTDLRLKVQGSNRSYWGPFSKRLARFKAPVFGGRAGVFYDEFIGQIPRSVLGWIDASGNGGGVASAAGEAAAAPGGQDHPGVVQLTTGTQSNGYGMVKYGENTIVLGGGLAHGVEFAARRVETSAQSEYRFGFMKATGDEGAYFKFGVPATSTSGELWFVCRKPDGSQTVYQLNEFDWGARWWRYRIEVAADASEIKLFRSFFNQDS